MKINIYKRLFLDERGKYGIRRHTCSCSKAGCGKDIVTSGFSVYTPWHVFVVSFKKPKNCDAPF